MHCSAQNYEQGVTSLSMDSCSTCAAGLMGGLTLEEAVDQKRLFWQDYHTVIAKDIAPRVGELCYF